MLYFVLRHFVVVCGVSRYQTAVLRALLSKTTADWIIMAHYPHPQKIAKRAVLIAAILIVANSYWIAYVEMIWHTAHLTIVALPVNVIFALLMLTWMNQGMKKIWPKAALAQRDLLVVYTMLAVGSAFSGHDCMPRLMGLMPHAFKHATPENDWEAIFFRYLPRWLVVDDPRTVKNFYEGESGFFSGKYVGSWIVPILAWSFAVFLLLLIFLSITMLLRRQWVEKERLSYPIIQIPLEITRESGRNIFRNRLLWVGFAIAAGIDIINGLNYFYPTVPAIPLRKYDLSQYLTDRPWNAMGATPLHFSPFLTGLAFLLPLDLSFSCVFFYMFGKAQRVIGSITGIHYVSGFPFLGEQGTGALLALVVVAMWASRRHIAHIFTSLFKARRDEEDANEPISYRSIVLGLSVCILLLMVFCIKIGMSVWAFAVFLAIYLTVVIGVTRMRAEMGPPIHGIGYATPQYIMVSLLGTRRVAAGNLTALSLLNWLSGSTYAAFRTHPMPHQLEAFKIADRARISNRTMLIVLVIACVVGIESSLWLYPYVIYKEGVAGASEQILAGGAETYTFLASWLTSPQPSNWMNIGVIGAAFVLNMGMMFMRARSLWFPLHPAGYVIGVAPGTIDKYWFTLLICTVIKALLLRHGGIRAYRKAVPFFIGMVLGQALIGCFWPLMSMIFRTAVYSWI